MKERKIWTYKGVNVYPAGVNGSGIRWESIVPHLRADTKESMRELINAAQQTAREKYFATRLTSSFRR